MLRKIIDPADQALDSRGADRLRPAAAASAGGGPSCGQGGQYTAAKGGTPATIRTNEKASQTPAGDERISRILGPPLRRLPHGRRGGGDGAGGASFTTTWIRCSTAPPSGREVNNVWMTLVTTSRPVPAWGMICSPIRGTAYTSTSNS